MFPTSYFIELFITARIMHTNMYIYKNTSLSRSQALYARYRAHNLLKCKKLAGSVLIILYWIKNRNYTYGFKLWIRQPLNTDYLYSEGCSNQKNITTVFHKFKQKPLHKHCLQSNEWYMKFSYLFKTSKLAFTFLSLSMFVKCKHLYASF